MTGRCFQVMLILIEIYSLRSADIVDKGTDQLKMDADFTGGLDAIANEIANSVFKNDDSKILNSNTQRTVTLDASISSKNTTGLIMVPPSLSALRSETPVETGETTVTKGNTTRGETNLNNTDVVLSPSSLVAREASAVPIVRSKSAIPVVGGTPVPSVLEGNTTHQENVTLNVLNVSGGAGDSLFVTPTASTVSTNKTLVQRSAIDTQNQTTIATVSTKTTLTSASETPVETGETTVANGNTTHIETNLHKTEVVLSQSPFVASERLASSTIPVVALTPVQSVLKGNKTKTHQENVIISVSSVSSGTGEGQFVTPIASTMSTNKAVIQRRDTDTENQPITAVSTTASLTTASETPVVIGETNRHNMAGVLLSSPLVASEASTTVSTTASPTTPLPTTQQPKAPQKGICALLQRQRLPLPPSCREPALETWNG